MSVPPGRQEKAARTTGLPSGVAAIGAVRVARDAWSQAGGKRSATFYIAEAFDALQEEIEGRR